MKKKKIADRVLLGLIGVITFGALGTISTQASNWHDRPYSIYYSGDGGDVYTPYADKTDDTSVYIKNDGDVRVWVDVNVAGSNRNFNWGGMSVIAPLGVGYKIDNSVWETFHTTVSTRLCLTPETHSPCRIYGVWSPDSI